MLPLFPDFQGLDGESQPCFPQNNRREILSSV
jgi:hypothetical protein